jgi:phosphoglucosamine mutase
LKSVRFQGGNPLEDATVKAAVEAGRVRLGKGGRLIIRPSGTEPVIRVMAEGDDTSLVTGVVNDILASIDRHTASASAA